MRTNHRITLLSFLLGLAVWIIDAALDTVIFHEGTFWDRLILDVPSHELAIRTIILVSLVVFGFPIAILVARREQEVRPLRHSETQYRSLFENMLNGFAYHKIVVDDNGAPSDYIFLETNAAFETLTGLKREGIIGKRVTEVLPGIERSVQDWIGAYGKVALTGEQCTFEQYSEPLERWYSVVAYSPAQGYFVTLFHDITQRKHAADSVKWLKEFNQNIIQTMADGVLVDDIEGIVQLVNPAAETMLGYDPGEMIGLHWTAFTPPDQHHIVHAANERRKHGDVDRYELELVRKDGTRLHTLVSGSPRMENGLMVGTLSVFTDITERKQAEQQRLALAVERARVKILADFIESASHEFATPLTVISTNLYLLKKSVDSEVYGEELAKLENQVAYIGKLVEAMLTMTRLDSQDGLSFAPLDLNHLLRAIEADLRPVADAKMLTLTLDLAGDVPAIQADVEVLRRALTNLVTNAIQYTPETGSVTVQTAIRDDHITVEISDTGTGINEADMPHVFERFYRADKARTTRGAGLGLSIAQKAIEVHRGTIAAQSVPGEGSTFTVAFPIDNG